MVNSEFKVSVLIAVYNAEHYITKAVESALAEEEVNEVILIEDASPDNALAVCKTLAQKYPAVKLLQHPDKKNRGAPASWNLGILHAENDYIAICGADDFFLPGRFKKDKEIFLNNESVEGVYNAIDAVPLDSFGDTRMDGPNNGMGWLTTMDRLYAPGELFEHIGPIGGGGLFSLNGLTVKKSVFEKTGLMDPALRLSQDTDICIKLAAICKLMPGQITIPVALYGVHENNRSHNSETVTTNRPYLFYNLYKWARRKRLARSRVFLLWERYYQYYLIVNKPSRKQQLILLSVQGIANPQLFRSRFFLRQLPLLHRIIS